MQERDAARGSRVKGDRRVAQHDWPVVRLAARAGCGHVGVEANPRRGADDGRGSCLHRAVGRCEIDRLDSRDRYRSGHIDRRARTGIAERHRLSGVGCTIDHVDAGDARERLRRVRRVVLDVDRRSAGGDADEGGGIVHIQSDGEYAAVLHGHHRGGGAVFEHFEGRAVAGPGVRRGGAVRPALGHDQILWR